MNEEQGQRDQGGKYHGKTARAGAGKYTAPDLPVRLGALNYRHVACMAGYRNIESSTTISSNAIAVCHD